MTDVGALYIFEAVNENEIDFIGADQCRAARALLDWTQRRLARRAAVAESTLIEFERGRRRALPATRRRLQDALTSAGVQFIIAGPENGVGVYLARRR